MDIKFAEEFGYHIKHLTVLKDQKNGLELRVHPTLVPVNHPLNSVKFDYNAVYIQTDLIGEFMLYGKGAGVYPAANMIIRDLVDVSASLKTHSQDLYEFPLWNEKPVLSISEIMSAYYLRFTCLDIPGVMGKIATVLGENNINISSAHASQRGYQSGDPTAYVHIFVERAKEKDITNAISTIRKLNIIKDSTTRFRIIGELTNVDSSLETG
jgi:homoserine dehydrogenase